MDPISQAVIGAIASGSVAKPTELRRAAGIGAFAGVIPDIDMLIRSSHDPLLFLEFHRQFTHALAFVPMGALMVAGLCRWFARDSTFGRLYVFALLGYATHGLIDACTSYGTQLLWPVSDLRVAWNNIAVVDPLLTLSGTSAIAVAWLRRTPRIAHAGLLFILLYLGCGVVQRERAEAAGVGLAETRGHAPERLFAKPTLGNLFLWKSVYEADGRYYVDAIRLGFDSRVFEGEHIGALSLERDLPWLEPGAQQAQDVERFRSFSADWLALDLSDPSRVVDVRYSLVPNQIEGLWGLSLERHAGRAAHARFFTRRDMTAEKRSAFLRMLIE
jgi:inner membrane protein